MKSLLVIITMTLAAKVTANDKPTLKDVISAKVDNAKVNLWVEQNKDKISGKIGDMLMSKSRAYSLYKETKQRITTINNIKKAAEHE
jgi:hypothetical protein